MKPYNRKYSLLSKFYTAALTFYDHDPSWLPFVNIYYFLNILASISNRHSSTCFHFFTCGQKIFPHSTLYYLLSIVLLSLPNNVWRLIVFAPFLIIIIIIILVLVILLSFRAPWTCPRQISGTTGQNFMKLGGVIDICF